MAKYNHLPIFQETYKLTLEIHQTVDQFPRAHKYVLGQRLKDITSDLMDLIVEANSKQEKAEILEQARLKLEKFRIHLRLSFDLKILGLKKYEYFSRIIEEISKQLSGWLDWAREKNSSFTIK